MTANTLAVRRREIDARFWTSQDVCELPTDGHRMMFVGLWCKADREGRLEDNAFAIGLRVRAWDPKGAAPLIDELVRRGMAARYTCDGRRYIWLPKFKLFQHVNPHEARSHIPPHPDEFGWVTAVRRPDQPPMVVNARAIEVTEKTNGAERKQPLIDSDGLECTPEPSEPSEPSEDLPVGRTKRVRAAKSEKPTDPRHNPMRAALIEAFRRKRGIEYPFDYGREDAEVRRLLKLGLEPTVLSAWEKALDSTYPTISTLAKFRLEFPRFVGRGETPKGAQSFVGTGEITATEGSL